METPIIELIARMKEAVEKAVTLMEVCEEEWFDSEHLQRSVRFVEDDADFIALCSPVNVSALIAERDALAAEVERQAGEIERLQIIERAWNEKFD